MQPSRSCSSARGGKFDGEGQGVDSGQRLESGCQVPGACLNEMDLPTGPLQGHPPNVCRSTLSRSSMSRHPLLEPHATSRPTHRQGPRHARTSAAEENPSKRLPLLPRCGFLTRFKHHRGARNGAALDGFAESIPRFVSGRSVKLLFRCLHTLNLTCFPMPHKVT